VEIMSSAPEPEWPAEARPVAAPRWLDQQEDRAWRGWLLMSDVLRWQLFKDLQEEAGLSDADFAVLVYLSEAEDSRLRMTDLAAALRWSKSRLSHQFTRMEGRGLVRRQNCPEDGRTTYAVLTTCGRREITRAAPLHLASVRRNFIDLLDRGQLAALAEITEVVSRHLLGEGDHSVPACPGETVGEGPIDAGGSGGGDLLSPP
jgi:DNA-binding MarR family transcriptional regulator